MAARRPARRFDPAHLVDVAVYLVVLNLATQLMPSVITETFTVSLLTAVLLKLVLEVVVAAKNALKRRIKSPGSTRERVLSTAALVVLLPGSKLVVLELVDLAFGSSVSLGGFVPVTGLIIVLILARAGVRRLMGPPAAATP